MSEERATPSAEDLARIYNASPGGGRIELPPVGEMDQATYNEAIARGMTPTAARDEAVHAAHLKKVYSRSRAKGSMRP